LSAWERARSDALDLARLARVFVPDPDLRAFIMRWAVAFAHALLVHCRCGGAGGSGSSNKANSSSGSSSSDGQDDVEAQFAGVLLPAEAAAVAAVGAASAPAFVLQVLSNAVEECGLGEHRSEQLQSCVRVSALSCRPFFGRRRW
jgi:hypothetical protein